MTFVDEDDRKLVKEVVRQNQGKLQERVVPLASLKKWATQVEQMTGDIERLVLVRYLHLPISLPLEMPGRNGLTTWLSDLHLSPWKNGQEHMTLKCHGRERH